MASSAVEKFMDEMERRNPPKRSYKPLLLVAGGIALVGGVAAVLAFRRRPVFDVTPVEPAALPVAQQHADTETAWQQFWYDRGYQGLPLGTIPEPTDSFWQLGAGEQRAGLPRRDLASRPPTAADWAAAGIARQAHPTSTAAAPNYPRTVVERGITWLVFPVPNPDTRADFECAMWPCDTRGSELTYPATDVRTENFPDGRRRYTLRSTGVLIWEG